MKHTRRKTLKRNFLARLQRAKLNYNPGKWETIPFRFNSKCAMRQKATVSPKFRGFSMKFANYYGIVIEDFIDPWDSHKDGRRGLPPYIELLDGYNRFEWIRIDCSHELTKKKHRRKLKKFIKRYGLEHKLLYK